MDTVLQYTELTDFSKENAQQGTSAYLLNAGEVAFGFLYRSPAIYTIAWDGILNFYSLEREALEDLPWHLSPGMVARWSYLELTRLATDVSLILAGESDTLEKYELRDLKKYSEYKKALQKYENILFARHDVGATWGGVPYAFTAENPRHSPGDGNELAIKLSRSLPFPRGLLAWVVDHHSKQRALMDIGFAFDSSSDILAKLTLLE